MLSEVQIGKDANPVRILLAGLAVQVKFHLGLEDQWLYPELLRSKDERLKGLATQYMSEMGNIKQAFEQYVGRWSAVQTIQAKPVDFIRETRDLIGVLNKRIRLENTELYPAFDKAA